MELEVVTDIEEITKYHKVFNRLIRSQSAASPRILKFTTPGGRNEIPVYYSKQNDIWWADTTFNSTKKFHNLFGIHPDFSRTNQILIQINYQKRFSNYKEGALWAKDSKGRIYLLHTGKMGGGVKGISIENINGYYSGQKASAFYNSKPKDFFIVCELNAIHAYSQVNFFINEIYRIKEILKSISIPNTDSMPITSLRNKRPPHILKKYTPEFWGKRKSYLKNMKVESNCDHGIVVDALRIELEQNFGFKGRCVKNGYIDLGIEKGGKPIAIFEFKTSIGTQAIYTAIGQLLLHSNNFKKKPAKIMVLPNTIETERENDIRTLGIQVLKYRWNGQEIKFTNLNLIKNVR